MITKQRCPSTNSCWIKSNSVLSWSLLLAWTRTKWSFRHWLISFDLSIKKRQKRKPRKKLWFVTLIRMTRRSDWRNDLLVATTADRRSTTCPVRSSVRENQCHMHGHDQNGTIGDISQTVQGWFSERTDRTGWASAGEYRNKRSFSSIESVAFAPNNWKGQF